MILLQAVGGLCNRMLAIDSAISLAQYFGKDLTVLWESNQLLNCNYSQLFDHKEASFYLIERPQKKYLLRQFEKIVYYARFKKFIYTPEFKRLRDQQFDFKQLKRYTSIYICGFNRFYPSNQLQQHFKPIPFLQKKIDLGTSKFNSQTIGLHLRRSDHKHAIAHSTTDQFIQKMDIALAKNESTNFFLSTDSREDEARLKSLYGDKILANNSQLDRNVVTGIQDALIDLYCLATSSIIYGSFQSSFSVAAAEIGGIDLIVIE